MCIVANGLNSTNVFLIAEVFKSANKYNSIKGVSFMCQ